MRVGTAAYLWQIYCSPGVVSKEIQTKSLRFQLRSGVVDINSEDLYKGLFQLVDDGFHCKLLNSVARNTSGSEYWGL